MSNIVGGSLSLGRDDDQVVLMFSGTLPPEQWEAFVEAIIQTANRFNVAVRPFGRELSVQLKSVPVTPKDIRRRGRSPK